MNDLAQNSEPQRSKAAAESHKPSSQGGDSPLQRAVDQAVIQRAAAVDGNATVGNPLTGVRNLNSTEYQRQIIRYGQGHAVRERISVYGQPGFGRNLGHLVGNGANLVRPSVNGVAHSEPIVIGRAYGAAQNNPNWAQANAAVDGVNGVAGGVGNRAHFTLHSERHPCGGCGPQLANARYHNNDAVSWNFPMANGTHDVAQSHIPAANIAFPGYHFGVDAARAWRLAGYKLTLIPPKKKEDDKKEDDKDGDKNTKKRSLDGSSKNAPRKQMKQGTLFDFFAKAGNKGVVVSDEATEEEPVSFAEVQNKGIMIDE